MSPVTAIVQARMSSLRLPGKVMTEVHGRPLIDFILERLACAQSIGKVVVATSTDVSDDAVAAHCERRGVDVHRGPLEDVAMRFMETFDRYAAEAYVRLSADSPMLDPEVVDRVVALYTREKPDLATNIFPRSFPHGQSCEVFAADTYRAAYSLFDVKDDYEHVTPFFYRHADRFKIANLRADKTVDNMNMAIDQPEDLARFSAVLERIDKPLVSYGWKELADLMRCASEITSEEQR